MSRIKMTTKPKISIVVPAYNMGCYLDRCMESIVRQSFDRFEVVLVDDGSTDETPLLCDRWAERDVRIRVLHTTNRGLSAARNAGLRFGVGEFVFFVDADDELTPYALESLVSVCDAADMTAFGWSLIDEYGGELALRRPIHDGMGSARDLIIQILSGPLRDYSWSYLFRRDALERYDPFAPFDEQVFLYEDAAFLEPFLRGVHPTVMFVPKVLYRHRRTQGSLSRKPNQRSAASGLDVAKRLATLEVPDGMEAAWDAKLVMLLLGADQLAPGRRSGTTRRAIAEELRAHVNEASIRHLNRSERIKLELWRWGLYRVVQVTYRALAFVFQRVRFVVARAYTRTMR